MGFQSRFGREEWLKPYVDVMLQDYAQSGPKRVTVVCPGFATDCLETLEEISMQNRELFLAQGGEAFDYVPCLNSSPAHVDVMEDVVLQHARRLAGTSAPSAATTRPWPRCASAPWPAARSADGSPAPAAMPLGRFLEVSLAAADVAESLAFYEALGFVQASVGEAWPHPYAVVTDGRLSLGLHGTEFESPLPTWVAPSLRDRLDALAALGVELEDARLDDLSLHQALLARPVGPAAAAARGAHVLAAGAARRALERARLFRGVRASPARDLGVASAFWERLGFVAFEPVTEPFGKVVASQPRPQRRPLRPRPAGAGAGVLRCRDAGPDREPARPGLPLRATPAARTRGHRCGDARGAGRHATAVARRKPPAD